MRILIAPNAFKNSLSAEEAAIALQTGLQQSALLCETISFPIGDGGDGTASLLNALLKTIRKTVAVHDPLGRIISSSFGITEDKNTAIIEMADASGLRLLNRDEYNPLLATSFGTGELLVAALNEGVQRIILCIGGSATVDGGTGMLRALGVTFYNAQQQELKSLPASLPELADIDLQHIDNRIFNTKIVVLCDVENYLLGEQGAAKIFGPQKGATEAGVVTLDNALQQLRTIILKKTGKDISLIKHGGAAGGIAATLQSILGGKLVNGIDYFLTISKVEEYLAKADLVITGEGSIDAQTLQGKGPYGIAKKAKEYHLPVIGIAGKVPIAFDEHLNRYFDVLLPINHEALPVYEAMQCTYENLVRTGKMLGNLLAINSK